MSAFDTMTIEGVGSAPSTPPASPFDTMKIVEGPRKPAATPSRTPASPAKMAVAGGAELVDMIWTGAFGMPLAAAKEGLTRVQRTVESQVGFGKGAKMTRKEIGQEAAGDATRILDQYGSPALSLLRRWGFIDQEDRTAVEQGFAKIMEKVEEAGTAVEAGTGRKVLKEDVTQAVNLAFGALGVKGAQLVGKGTLSRMKAREAAKALDEFVGEKQAANAAEAAGDAARTATPVDAATNAQARATAALTPEGVGKPGSRPGVFHQTTPERRAELKEMRKELRARFAEDRYEPARPDSPQAEAARVQQQADRMPAEGQSFEMPRGYGSGPTGDWLRGGAAVGVGLGSLYALSQDNPEVAAAMAAGAFTLRGGKGLTLEALRTMPDATPLGRFVEQSSHVLGVVEQLNQQSPGRFEFKVDAVRQLLKQDKVTKAEREIIGPVLDAAPGDTITAKQLMEGIKARTGDFELKRVESDDFASYGAERINRGPEQDVVGADDFTTTIYQSPVELGTANHFSDPNYFAHTRSFTEGGVRHVVEMQSDVAQKAGKELAPEVRAELEGRAAQLEDRIAASQEWNSRIDRGEATPGARRTVLQPFKVELAEIKAKLAGETGLDAARPMLKDWHKRLVREEVARAAGGEVNPEWALRREQIKSKMRYMREWEGPRDGQAMQTLQRQIEADGAELLKIPERLPPAKVLRFADADTVAKVEGWPDRVEVYNRTYRGSAEERAGMVAPPQQRFSPQRQGIYDRYAGPVAKFLKQLGAKHVTDAQGHGWWEVPLENNKALGPSGGRRVQQFGGLDADLAKAIAAIGGGTALGIYLSDRENRLGGGIQGAIVGLAALMGSRHPAFRDAAQAAGSAAEYGLGLASTRVRNISEALHWRMVKHEGDVLKLSHDALAATEKFSNYLRKLPADAKGKLNRDILSADFGAVLRGLSTSPEMLREWQKVRAVLQDLGGQLKDAGKLKELLTDYYPRVVVDAEGLLNALGKEKRGYIDQQLDKARLKAARLGQELSPLEISTIINRALKSQAAGTGRPGFLKRRTVQEITPELEPFYAPASESLPLYIRAVVREVERAKFFGEDLVRDAETGVVDIDTSIGNLVQQERIAGNLTRAQEAELTSILKSRFGPGERSMNKYLQAAKNLSYAGLLGHVTSAIPQLADTAMAFYAHGFLPTVKAMQAVSKRKFDRVTVKDVGLADHVVEELTGGTAKPRTLLGFQLSSAKFLQKSFKYSGFSLTDQFGKNVHLNAAWGKYRGWAQNAAGVERIRAKYGKALGGEFDALVGDLREGKLTDRTRTLLFTELSDMQPVSKLEVPQGYLDMPNGRVVYMLKTWMLKQADIVRRDVAQRAARGDKRGALEAGLRFSLILGISGASVEAVKNALLGREDPLELSDIPNNVLKTFALSEYTMDKVRQGKPLEAAVNVALPPYKMWDEILARDPKAMNNMPVIGRIIYADNLQDLGISTGFHGAAKANLREDAKRKKEEEAERFPERVKKQREAAKAAYEKRLRERELQ